MGARMNKLLPPASSATEHNLAECNSAITHLPIALRHLCDPASCPTDLLPYLAWAMSVDRWDPHWPDRTRRSVINIAFSIHQHKGTTQALRDVIEPFGYLRSIVEWWQTGGTPGTFSLEIGVLDTGITPEMYQEMERLIEDVKPVSRHLTGINIIQDVTGRLYVGGTSTDGEIISIYPDMGGNDGSEI